MTRTEITPNLTDLNLEARRLIAKFGRWKTLRAILHHLLRPESVPPDATSVLNDHLLKDIGLPPSHPSAQRWMPPRF